MSRLQAGSPEVARWPGRGMRGRRTFRRHEVQVDPTPTDSERESAHRQQVAQRWVTIGF